MTLFRGVKSGALQFFPQCDYLVCVRLYLKRYMIISRVDLLFLYGKRTQFVLLSLQQMNAYSIIEKPNEFQYALTQVPSYILFIKYEYNNLFLERLIPASLYDLLTKKTTHVAKLQKLCDSVKEELNPVYINPNTLQDFKPRLTGNMNFRSNGTYQEPSKSNDPGLLIGINPRTCS